jgi:hypothetical protein
MESTGYRSPVVYHGSSKEFDKGHNTKRGIFFSTNKDIAKHFSGDTGTVKPAKLIMETPFIFDAHNENWADLPLYDILGYDMDTKEGEQQFIEFLEYFNIWDDEYSFPEYWEYRQSVGIDELVNWVHTKLPQYDGIVAKNLEEGGFIKGDVHVVFNTSQIRWI